MGANQAVPNLGYTLNSLKRIVFSCVETLMLRGYKPAKQDVESDHDDIGRLQAF
jgi:hypothetical protein